MRSQVPLLCVAILSLVACSSGSPEQNQSPAQPDPGSHGAHVKLQPREDGYVLNESARRFAGVDKLTIRKSSSAFAGNTIVRPKFATSTATKAMAALQETAQRFFLATNRTQGTTVDLAALATAKPKSGLPFIALALGDGAVAAGAFPESTGFLLRHAPSKPQHASRLKDSTEAVNVALSFIADRSLLSLQSGEGLDLINVQSIYTNETDERGFGQAERVAHHVVFGRTYKGVPVDGGMVLVALDSDGGVSTFHKAWRDIIGESQVRLASESTIQSRRDPDKVAYLIEKQRTCVLTEDPDMGAIHQAAGVACRFTYSDPLAGAALSRTMDEWVNAAEDPSIPLKGSKPAKPASLSL